MSESDLEERDTTIIHRSLFEYALGGDTRAAELLIRSAFQVVDYLRQLASDNPEVLYPISQRSCDWPALTGRSKNFHNRDRMKLIKQLKLGEKLQIDLTGIDRESPMSMQAFFMVGWLQQNQEGLQLPNLNKNTWEKWFETGWKYHCFAAGNEPEQHGYLRNHVFLAASSVAETRAKDPKRNEKANTTGIIKRKIKGQLKQAFKKLVGNAIK
jgi:hypothetical protein